MTKKMMLLFCMELVFVTVFRVSFAKKMVPKSLSFENIELCFPELKNSSLFKTNKIQSENLRKVIDAQFPTSRSYLRFRRVEFHGSDAAKHIMTIYTEGANIQKAVQHLKLEKVGTDGSVKELVNSRRTDPKPVDIQNVLQGVDVDNDDTSYIDIKNQGLELSYSLRNTELVDLEISDKRRKLFCENQKDQGVICSCRQKK